MNKNYFVRFSSLYGSCENFRTYKGEFLIVFKLMALCSFMIKGTGLPSFVLKAFGFINKGIETDESKTHISVS